MRYYYVLATFVRAVVTLKKTCISGGCQTIRWSPVTIGKLLKLLENLAYLNIGCYIIFKVLAPTYGNVSHSNGVSF